MKIFRNIAVSLLVLSVFSCGENNGKGSLLVKKGCTTCHVDDRRLMGPSFREVFTAYSGDAARLDVYFLGEVQPVVDPENRAGMEPMRIVVSELSAEERQLLISEIFTRGGMK